MSDGADKVAGSDTTINLNGKKYACTRIRFKHMAEASRHVLESRKDVMEEMDKRLSKISDENRQDFLDAAMRRVEKQPKPDGEEMRQFMSSLDGAKFLLWMMLRDHNPEFKELASVDALIADVEPEILGHKIAKASGLLDTKNSSGLARSESGQAQTSQTTDQKPLPGQTSTSN